jgi:hypothetical protein
MEKRYRCSACRAIKQNMIYVTDDWSMVTVQRGESLRDNLKECEGRRV